MYLSFIIGQVFTDCQPKNNKNKTGKEGADDAFLTGQSFLMDRHPYRARMSSKSCWTFWSCVAQLVQKRTTVWVSSYFSQISYEYFCANLSICSQVRIGNCWLVEESLSIWIPFSSKARRIAIDCSTAFLQMVK